jgi:3-oxoacyl-[acyl-carrier-protein] synthase III
MLYVVLKMNDHCFLASIGSYIPNSKIACDELAQKYEVFDRIYDKQVKKPITEKSIIEIASIAAKEAISSAKIKADEINLIIGSSTGPGLDVGLSFSAGVQNQLGAYKSECLDVGVRCIGCIQSIDIARLQILFKSKKNVLIVVVSKSSATLTKESIKANPSCVYFGDGAASAVLTNSPVSERKITFGPSRVITHGEYWNASSYIYDIRNGASTNLKLFFAHNILGDGYKKADRKITKELLLSVSEEMGISLEKIDGLVTLNRSNNYKEFLYNITNLPPNSIFISQDNYGHLGPVDLFLNLKKFLEIKKKFSKAILFATSFGYHWGAIPIYEL